MNHSQCARCGEPLAEEFQAAIAAGVDAIAKACGVAMSLKPVCDTCDAILDRQAKAEAIRQRYVDAHAEGDIPQNLERYRVPPKSLKERNPQAWAEVRGSESAWLHGLEGVGKSSLCRQALCRIFEAGGSVAIVQGVEFEQRLTSYGAEQEIRKLSRVRGLLIDDIDAGQWTVRGLGVLRAILDARHELGRITLVTSNADPKGVLHLFGGIAGQSAAETMLARLRPLRIVEMKGGSYRREALTVNTPSAVCGLRHAPNAADAA